ncbi:uncharacterized protein LOC134193783 [Corticium candelabrum]|uniref:uncharacterized protein LOC134193783 n=1 Tax=Corticium candelabrum TaxID=121492 RepID=UPI002E264670|nr:uncharacterized protein LOC134193783 [Corticium candelabrum]
MAEKCPTTIPQVTFSIQFKMTSKDACRRSSTTRKRKGRRKECKRFCDRIGIETAGDCSGCRARLSVWFCYVEVFTNVMHLHLVRKRNITIVVLQIKSIWNSSTY